jgi:HAD superfamily hydrolase (TIGR01509 family)
MLDAFIFDIDGTLVDSNGAHIEAWCRAFEMEGYQIPPDRIALEIGKGGDKLVPSILGKEAEERYGKSLRESQAAVFTALTQERPLQLFPGAVELIDTLRDRGLRTALATSSSREQFEALVDNIHVDLRTHVDEVVHRVEGQPSKPDPALVVSAVEALGLSPAQCAMVGDTSYDGAACRLAGVVCLGVESGGVPANELKRAGVRAVWRDVGAILADLDGALCRASPAAIRLDRHRLDLLMGEALAAAREGMAKGEVPIGAVLARGDGTVIARGYDEMHGSRMLTAHAELMAFAHAAGAIAPDARDLILISTLEPCVMCTGAAMETAVDTIVYGLKAPADSGTARVEPPESPDNGMPRIVGDIRAKESRALLVDWLRVNGNAEQRGYVEQVLERT